VCNDSAENWADAKAPSCFKVRKSSRTARLRRCGLSFPDQGQVIFPGCAARAALKATLEEGLTERWIIGSNDVATITETRHTQDGSGTQRETDRQSRGEVDPAKSGQ